MAALCGGMGAQSRMPPGILSVTVQFAEGLKDKDATSRSDPYAIVSCGKQEFHTHARSGSNPVWNETFEFSVDDETHIDIKIMDADIGKDDFLGKTRINLLKVRTEGTDVEEVKVHSKWLHLNMGKIGVALRWNHAGAPGGTMGGGMGQQHMMAGGVGHQQGVPVAVHNNGGMMGGQQQQGGVMGAVQGMLGGHHQGQQGVHQQVPPLMGTGGLTQAHAGQQVHGQHASTGYSPRQV